MIEERDHDSFCQAAKIAKRYNMRHYFMGNDRQFLVVETCGKIRMFKDITKK